MHIYEIYFRLQQLMQWMTTQRPWLVNALALLQKLQNSTLENWLTPTLLSNDNDDIKLERHERRVEKIPRYQQISI